MIKPLAKDRYDLEVIKYPASAIIRIFEKP